MFEILPLMSLTIKFWREMRSRTRRRECLQIDKQCINDWSAKPRLNQKQTTPYGRCFIGNGSVKWRRSQFLAALCRLWTVSSPVVSLPFPAYPTPATVHPRCEHAFIVGVGTDVWKASQLTDWLLALFSRRRNETAEQCGGNIHHVTAAAVLSSYLCVVKV